MHRVLEREVAVEEGARVVRGTEDCIRQERVSEAGREGRGTGTEASYSRKTALTPSFSELDCSEL